VLALGATRLPSTEPGFRVYADPAGHPFCIGWGHPSREAVATLVATREAQHGN